ncbi:MAG: peptide-methionine (S)-S-oxide reductase MsrA, partial [Erysipelotrichaceae bacterium]|nr:peptide-methionine (S)-S-oxide reductase MsrA [Erysipelotrichaceae bacterium]
MEKTIYLAGGCFWGTERAMQLLDGVVSTTVGYANGHTENPSYEQVKAHAGHAETVRVVYDPAVLPLRELLRRYFLVIDPTAVNHQGEDWGEQYRTGIYYMDEKDAPVIQKSLKNLAARYDQPLAVECEPLRN